MRDVLWCAFSRLIITKQAGASLAMDLSHSRPHRTFSYAPVKPFRRFLAAVNRVVRSCIDRNQAGGVPVPTVHEGDARNLPLPDASIDLVLTSPPYLNAIDYFRCSKFSLVWMGQSIAKLRDLRRRSLGSEAGAGVVPDEESREILVALKLKPSLAARDEAVLLRYICDMRAAVREVARVLSRCGTAVYVIGENTIRGTFIRNALIVTAVAQLSGLRLKKRRGRQLPANRRYLPPPSAERNSAALAARMRREVVLSFSRLAA